VVRAVQKAAGGAEQQPALRIKRRAPQKAGEDVCVHVGESECCVASERASPNLISDFKRLFNERARPTLLLLHIHLRYSLLPAASTLATKV